jgi:RHS repeat-associated protein
MSRSRFIALPPWTLAAVLAVSFFGCGFDTAEDSVASTSEALTHVVEQAPVRRLSGVPSVEPNGQATYEIPLNVPPGRRGVAPTLSLRYGSGAGEGYFGQGFDLVGAGSRIHRCQKSVEDDGEASALHFDEGDRLCLDGMRLVGPGSDAAYWQIGARYQEQMSAWRRIERTGQDEFVVTGRDGSRHVFGPGTSTVRTLRGDRDATGAMVDPTTVVLEWRLARIEDAYGNYIAFDYAHEDHPDGAHEHYLTAIRYTGAPGEAPQREVRLHYEARGAAETSYLAGTGRRLSRLVTQIEMRVREQSVRRYELDYKTDEWTRRSLLRGIRECDRFELCRDTTMFEWSEPSWAPEVESLVVADPILYENVAVIPNAPIAQSVLSVDVDGDGRDDLVHARQDAAGDLTLHAGLSRPHGIVEVVVPGTVNTLFYGGQPYMAVLPTGAERNSLLLRDSSSSGHWWKQVEYVAGSWVVRSNDVFARVHDYNETLGVGPVVGDFDGDGAADAFWRCVRRNPEGPFAASLHEWRLSRFLPESHWFGSPPREALLVAEDRSHWNVHIPVDLDGDRRLEVLARGPDALTLTPIGTPAELLAPVHIDPNEKWLFADLNADGLADLLTVRTGSIELQLNTGRGFEESSVVFSPPSNWGDAPSLLAPEDIRQGDFDRDGRPDLLVMLVDSDGVGRASVLRWNGSEFVAFDLPYVPHAVTVAPAGLVRGQVTTFVTVLDHDGDGHPEFTQLREHEGDMWIEAVQPTITVRPSSLVRVVDGHSNPEFDYADLSEVHFDNPFGTGHPQPQRVCGVDEETGEYECVELSPALDCISSYPVQCVRNGMWVGTHLTVDDGIGGRREVSRRYSSARVDVRRGLGLGFARSQLVSITNAEVVDTEFDLTQFDVRDASGTIVDRRFPFAGQIRHENVFRWPSGELDEATWPPTSDRVVVHRKELGRRLQRARVDALGDDVVAYRAVSTFEEIQIYDAASWKPGQELLPSDRIHHWRTDHLPDAWGTTVSTTFKDLLGDTSTLSVSNVANDVDDFRIGRVERRTVWSSESVFSESRSTKYVHETSSAGVVELRQVIVDEGEDEERTLDFQYDAHGNVIRVDESGANPDPSPGEPAQLRRHQEVEFEDVEHMFVEATTNALGHRTTFEFVEASGRIASSTDPNGIAQNWLYDGFDHLVGHVHEGMVDQWALAPSPEGCFVEKAFLQGRTAVETHYDCLNRPRRVVEVWPDGRRSTARVTYDAVGRLASESLPVFEGEPEYLREYTYDGLDRLIRLENPDGSFQTWTHTRRTAVHRNEQGGDTTSDFDTMGRIASVSDAGDVVTKHFYGAFSRLRATDRLGSVTELAYTTRGDLLELKDPSRGYRRYVHNVFGEVEREVGLDGVRDFDYDALGRPAVVVEPDGTRAKFEYDSSARGIGSIAATTREGDDVTTKHQYDLYGRASGMALVVGDREIAVTASRSGRLLDRLTYDFGDWDPVVIDYAYEGGRVTTVEASHASWSTRLWTTVERDDAAGRATVVDRGYRMTREFDPLNGREALYEARLGTQVLEAHSYVYDVAHYLKTDIDSIAGESFAYDYDEQGRLEEYTNGGGSTLASYLYDGFGNQRLGANGERTFDDPNRPNILTGAEGLTFDHDDAGRRVGRSDGWAAEYHAFDLPRWIDDPASGRTDYGYDAFENRVTERLGTLEVIRFAGVRQLYDDGNRKETSIGVMVEGERVAEIVVSEGDARVRWLSDGPHGTAQFSVENGNVSRHPRSDPFGGTTGGGDLWSQFAGHDYELKSPLVNAGARIYDPDNAVFLSPDPVLATAGIGAAPYQYAFQNPNSYTDPTGMWPIGTGGIDCLTAGCLELHGIDVVLDPTGTHYVNRGLGRPDGLNAGTAHGDSRGGGRATAGTGRSFVDTDLALVNMVDRLGVDDFFAGMGDSLSFGLTGRFRGATGIDGAGGSVDRSSDAYDNGEWGAVATSLANVPGLIRSGVRWATSAALRSGGAAGAAENIVYRGLAAGEDAAKGLFARSPGAGNSVASHVAGKRASQWISTTRSEVVARDVFGKHGYVKIDLSRVGREVVDITRGIPGMDRGMLSNWARKFEEVLVRDEIPVEAIIEIFVR